MPRKKRKAKRPDSPPSRTAAATRISSVAPRLAALALCALFLVHVAVYGWRVMAERNLSRDSFNYVTVARNLSEGRGFVQSAPGFNHPSFWGEDFKADFPPQTRSTHSILYPPLIFAAAETTGMGHADAALLVSALAYFAVLSLVFLLALRIWGAGGGMLAVAAVAVAPPGADWLKTDWLFTWAWTEPAATALLLGTLVLLAKNPGRRAFAAAGVLAGLAYLQRSGMLPLVGAGILAALAMADRRRMLALFLAGASVGLVRPLGLVGEGIIYKTYAPSTHGAGEVVSSYVPAMGPAWLALAGLALAVYWRTGKGGRKGGKGGVLSLFSSGEILLLVWIAAGSAFPFVAALVYYFPEPPSAARFLYPAKIAVAVLGAGLGWRALSSGRGRMMLAGGIFALAMAGGIVRDGGILAERRDVSDRTRIAESGLLRWLDENLGARDFVVGMDVVDLPYYFPGRAGSAPSISPHPLSPIVSAERLSAAVRHRCGKFGNYYLLIRGELPSATFGPFIDGLRAGRPAAKTEILAARHDGIVYRLTHCDEE